jgi:hypothetical protein
MLILFAIVCLAIPLVIQSRRLRDAEIELSKLRDETGRLTITDRNKIHVLAVASAEPGSWRWRIFMPKGLRYGWSLAAGDIPGKGLPKSKTDSFWNAQGEDQDREVLVTATLMRMENGDWRLSVSSRIGESDQQMGGGNISFADEIWKSAHSGCEVREVLGSKAVKLIDPGEPIVLFVQRGCGTPPDGGQGPTEDATPGYAIWMNPF